MKDWSNQTNTAFYANLHIETLKEYAVKGGLSEHIDMVQLKPYLDESMKILEVGACYGRVLDFLTQNYLEKKLFAIERDKKYSDSLINKYGENVDIKNLDIIDFETEERFDLILWMWSGISDFSENEQPNVLMHLSHLLSDGGKLIVETLSCNAVPLNSSLDTPKTYIIKEENAVGYGYIPSEKEMDRYSKDIGCQKISKIPYQTKTGRDRVLYVLFK